MVVNMGNRGELLDQIKIISGKKKYVTVKEYITAFLPFPYFCLRT